MKIRRHKPLVLPEVGDAFTRHSAMAFAFAKCVDSPRSLGLWMRYKYGEHKQLADVSIHPREYQDATAFGLDYSVYSFFAKYKGLKTGTDLKAAALLTFKQGEDQCRVTNQRLRDPLRLPPTQNAIFLMAKRKIARLLGPCPSYFDFCEGMWGPGVTSTLRGDDATLADKLLERNISVSASALPYLRAELGRDIHWARARGINAEAVFSPLLSEFHIENHCRVTTVPKNAKTDRTIAIEPTGNIFLQKAIGRFIRSCLRKVGVDLNDQTVNQRLAREGSLTLLLATLDLKAASDTVAFELVAQLLPFDWFCLLDRIRSRYFKLGKDISRFEKFSTMGNGFTFELESLLFWAIAHSASEISNGTGWCAVYGDDLVCRTSEVQEIVEALEHSGFTLNLEKSHYDTPFRESCGSHFYGGLDVSPIYQKETLSTYEECIKSANRIHRRAIKALQDETCLPMPPKFRSVWKAAINGINFVDFVPLDCEEDTGLAVRRADFPRSSAPSNGGILLRGLSIRPISKHLGPVEDEVGLALWLRQHQRVNHSHDAAWSPRDSIRPDVLHLESSVMRKRYRLRRKTRWYPGATELGFSLHD